MRRFGRYMALIAVWYVILFFAGDAAWHHFAHHPIPAWASDVRFGLWIYVVIRDKIPGYKRFVSDRAPKSNMVPEIPTGPLVGWRAWRIGNGTSGLMSLTAPITWPVGEAMVSHCIKARWDWHGDAPYSECNCGLHAFSGPLDAQVIRLSRRIAVYGPVLTWGRTQVHETGWRSQYAKPLALVRPRILTPKIRRRLDLILEGLSKEYGVPVLSLKEAKKLADRMAQQ